MISYEEEQPDNGLVEAAVPRAPVIPEVSDPTRELPRLPESMIEGKEIGAIDKVEMDGNASQKGLFAEEDNPVMNAWKEAQPGISAIDLLQRVRMGKLTADSNEEPVKQKSAEMESLRREPIDDLERKAQQSAAGEKPEMESLQRVLTETSEAEGQQSVPTGNTEMEGFQRIPAKNLEMEPLRQSVSVENPGMETLQQRVPIENPELEALHRIQMGQSEMQAVQRVPEDSLEMQSVQRVPMESPEMQDMWQMSAEDPNMEAQQRVPTGNPHMDAVKQPVSGYMDQEAAEQPYFDHTGYQPEFPDGAAMIKEEYLQENTKFENAGIQEEREAEWQYSDSEQQYFSESGNMEARKTLSSDQQGRNVEPEFGNEQENLFLAAKPRFLTQAQLPGRISYGWEEKHTGNEGFFKRSYGSCSFGRISGKMRSAAAYTRAGTGFFLFCTDCRDGSADLQAFGRCF